MSLDYPEFEKIKERNKLLGILWRIGDMGYYTGLLLAVIAPLCLVGNFCIRYLNAEFDFGTFVFKATVFGGGSFIGFLLLFYLSASLKGFVHRKSGIHENNNDEQT